MDEENNKEILLDVVSIVYQLIILNFIFYFTNILWLLIPFEHIFFHLQSIIEMPDNPTPIDVAQAILLIEQHKNDNALESSSESSHSGETVLGEEEALEFVCKKNHSNEIFSN